MINYIKILATVITNLVTAVPVIGQSIAEFIYI